MMEPKDPLAGRSQLATGLWVAGATALFVYVLWPYMFPFIWACVLAVIFYPLRIWLEQRGHLGRIGAVLATMLACIAVVVIPSLIVLAGLTNELAKLQQTVSIEDLDLEKIVAFGRSLLPSTVDGWITSLDTADGDLSKRIMDGLSNAAGMASNYVFNVGQNTALFIVAVGVMLYLLFFFLLDGARIVRTVTEKMPLAEGFKKNLLDVLAGTIRAAVTGNTVIAALQGTVGGITLWLLGIEAAFLLGTLMALLSLLPAVGAPGVWIPVAAWLALTGNWFDAIVLVAMGALVIGSIDNLLRPPLVSKGAQMPDYIVFLSTLGGIAQFGISGFVIGPIIAAIFLTTWRQMPPRQAREEADI